MNLLFAGSDDDTATSRKSNKHYLCQKGKAVLALTDRKNNKWKQFHEK